MAEAKVLQKEVREFVKIEKESKNCYRYEEVVMENKPTLIGGLYVRKDAVKGVPVKLRVTLEVLE
ncbi:MAG: hypothetical protein ACTSQE_17010 [Candidatus Heimdallarchaeaceae archaeon]